LNGGLERSERVRGRPRTRSGCGFWSSPAKFGRGGFLASRGDVGARVPTRKRGSAKRKNERRRSELTSANRGEAASTLKNRAIRCQGQGGGSRESPMWYKAAAIDGAASSGMPMDARGARANPLRAQTSVRSAKQRMGPVQKHTPVNVAGKESGPCSTACPHHEPKGATKKRSFEVGDRLIPDDGMPSVWGGERKPDCRCKGA